MEKEKALLEHYNRYPRGGTKMRSPKELGALLEWAGIQLTDRSMVLDLGCASGVTSDIVRKYYRSNVLGVDFSEARIAIAIKERPKTKYLCMDMHKFLNRCIESNKLFNRNRYDLILLFDTLEHLEDPASLIALAKEILRSGGKILAKTPLNHVYVAHLQVYSSREDFDSRLNPDASFVYGKSVVAVWGSS